MPGFQDPIVVYCFSSAGMYLHPRAELEAVQRWLEKYFQENYHQPIRVEICYERPTQARLIEKGHQRVLNIIFFESNVHRGSLLHDFSEGDKPSDEVKYLPFSYGTCLSSRGFKVILIDSRTRQIQEKAEETLEVLKVISEEIFKKYGIKQRSFPDKYGLTIIRGFAVGLAGLSVAFIVLACLSSPYFLIGTALCLVLAGVLFSNAGSSKCFSFFSDKNIPTVNRDVGVLSSPSPQGSQ